MTIDAICHPTLSEIHRLSGIGVIARRKAMHRLSILSSSPIPGLTSEKRGAGLVLLFLDCSRLRAWLYTCFTETSRLRLLFGPDLVAPVFAVVLDRSSRP
jgi:hypothetical protein